MNRNVSIIKKTFIKNLKVALLSTGCFYGLKFELGTRSQRASAFRTWMPFGNFVHFRTSYTLFLTADKGAKAIRTHYVHAMLNFSTSQRVWLCLQLESFARAAAKKKVARGHIYVAIVPKRDIVIYFRLKGGRDEIPNTMFALTHVKTGQYKLTLISWCVSNMIVFSNNQQQIGTYPGLFHWKSISLNILWNLTY